jgi:hypothetical protein
MILIYETLPIDKDRIDESVNRLVDRYSPFFIDEGSITFTTETNPKLLVEVVNKYNVFLFYTYSLEGMKQMGFSLKEIGELIMQLLKNECSFHSETDKLFFDVEDDSDKVFRSLEEIIGKRDLQRCTNC